MQFSTKGALALAGLAVIGLTLPAHAQFFQAGTGLADPSVTYSFGTTDFANGTPITGQYPGVTFDDMFYNTDYSSTGFPNISGALLTNFPPNSQTNLSTTPSTITFFRPVDAAAFTLITDGGLVTFTAFLGSTPVATGTGRTTVRLDDIFGFNNLVFDKIVIDSSALPNRAILLDNLQYQLAPAAVPEASTTVSLGLLLALGGVRVAARRKKTTGKTGTAA